MFPGKHPFRFLWVRSAGLERGDGVGEPVALEFLDAADTRKYLEAGTFAEGTMAPKIVAALNFVENGGIKSIITEASKLEDKSYGSKITLNY